MDALIMDMSDSLHVLDLSEDQESTFVDMVEGSMSRLVSLYTEGRGIDDHLSKLQKIFGFHLDN